jgi:hypothetical protein
VRRSIARARVVFDRSNKLQRLPEAMADLSLSAMTLSDKQPYFARRVQLFEQFKARAQDELAAARARAEPISVTLPDGTVKTGVKWVTTPLEIALSISKSLAGNVVVAKVDDAVWDVFRPLEGDCQLKLCTFEDTEGRDVRAAAATPRSATRPASPRLTSCSRLAVSAHRRSGTAAHTCWARCWS